MKTKRVGLERREAADAAEACPTNPHAKRRPLAACARAGMVLARTNGSSQPARQSRPGCKTMKKSSKSRAGVEHQAQGKPAKGHYPAEREAQG